MSLCVWVYLTSPIRWANVLTSTAVLILSKHHTATVCPCPHQVNATMWTRAWPKITQSCLIQRYVWRHYANRALWPHGNAVVFSYNPASSFKSLQTIAWNTVTRNDQALNSNPFIENDSFKIMSHASMIIQGYLAPVTHLDWMPWVIHLTLIHRYFSYTIA